jgi:hypothetical protein
MTDLTAIAAHAALAYAVMRLLLIIERFIARAVSGRTGPPGRKDHLHIWYFRTHGIILWLLERAIMLSVVVNAISRALPHSRPFAILIGELAYIALALSIARTIRKRARNKLSPMEKRHQIVKNRGTGKPKQINEPYLMSLFGFRMEQLLVVTAAILTLRTLWQHSIVWSLAVVVMGVMFVGYAYCTARIRIAMRMNNPPSPRRQRWINLLQTFGQYSLMGPMLGTLVLGLGSMVYEPLADWATGAMAVGIGFGVLSLVPLTLTVRQIMNTSRHIYVARKTLLHHRNIYDFEGFAGAWALARSRNIASSLNEGVVKRTIIVFSALIGVVVFDALVFLFTKEVNDLRQMHPVHSR